MFKLKWILAITLQHYWDVVKGTEKQCACDAAAAWNAITPLSEQSIELGNETV